MTTIPKKRVVHSERPGRILDMVRRNGSVSIRQVSGDLGVSLVTARGDLKYLENAGLVLRTRGGVWPEPLLYRPFLHDSSFQEQMERLTADIAFVGANGIDPDQGLTCFNQDEAALIATVVDRPKRRIVVPDHRRLSVVATHKICSVEAVHLLITDTAVSEEAVTRYVERGIEIRLV
jgi:DeoR/GlpR family transcriptional regulator of sugar metabolism